MIPATPSNTKKGKDRLNIFNTRDDKCYYYCVGIFLNLILIFIFYQENIFFVNICYFPYLVFIYPYSCNWCWGIFLYFLSCNPLYWCGYHCGLHICWISPTQNFGGLQFDFFARSDNSDWCWSYILCRGESWYDTCRVRKRVWAEWIVVSASWIVGNLNI